MYDLNTVRKYTEDLYSIVKVGEIETDLFGEYVIMKDVIVALFQEELYFIPDLLINTKLAIDAENLYRIWMHETTREIRVDYSDPTPIEPKLQLPLLFAVLIYFQDNAKGIRQNLFLKLFKEKLLSYVNQGN